MSAFAPIGAHGQESDNGDSFWPAFTDIMMVVVLIFLLATSLLIVRNYNLVAELQDSIEAEKMAAMVIETTTMENATLEERLINAEQLNSILRLRLLKKDELLRKAEREDIKKLQTITELKSDKDQLNKLIQNKLAELTDASLKINIITAESEEFANQLDELKLQLEQQRLMADAAQMELKLATAEIAALNATTEQQSQEIDLLEQEKIEYNRQLLTLKGEYEVVKSKYDQLIKPARSEKGKYVVEVFYVKEKAGKIIRFKQPGDENSRDISMVEVEKRLDQLKKEKGADLYVKIIIPKNSGLTYNEAWGFMKRLLDRYDYYYQGDTKLDNSKQ
jgi:DNA repair exonuclease SbcCD ATPase subunit